ncbi:MAG: S49 family peptidase [Candidatus Rokubacteria bacterium]|nr:S49 family peptidase [Candidatus Rokubacteria bacterium]
MYKRILSYVLRTPWAVEPEMLAELAAILAPRVAGVRLSDEEIAQRVHAAQARAAARGAGARVGVVAVMPIIGLLLSRAGALEQVSGAMSVQDLALRFKALVADDAVGAIVLDIDSPGGEVGGIAEFADQIFEGRARKPIVAVANPLMASAAYWIGASASALLASPSALVGSIGVYAAHEDVSKALEAAGIAVTLVAAGKDKTLGNPFEPLSPDGRAYIQDRVNEFYDLFVRAVARGRGTSQKTVREGMGQGRVVTAAEAVTLGMADSVGTLDDAIALAGRRAQRSAERAETDPVGVQTSVAGELDRRRRRLRLAGA